MIDDNLPEILINYLNYNANLNKSKGTINEYKYDLVSFIKYIKKLKSKSTKIKIEEININDLDVSFFNKITLNDIYSYMSYLKDECNNVATSRARKVASIKSFFKYLHLKAKLIDDNPAKELESPKLGKRLPKYLTLEQSTTLLDNVKNKTIGKNESDNRIRDYAIIVLFLNCGMRLSELVGINIHDIKFDESLVTVIGKGNKERTVYLNLACIDAINEYLEERPTKGLIDQDALFLSERKKRISRRTVQYIIKSYLSRIDGLKNYSTHKLRHTAATLMYQYGNVDIRALQEILGHESISTTEIYTHIDNAQIRQAVENNPLANYRSKK
jgi:site-specific recombinase XerD